jgi:hypothetical protein
VPSTAALHDPRPFQRAVLLRGAPDREKLILRIGPGEPETPTGLLTFYAQRSFRDNRPLGALLQAQNLPKRDGDTEFTDVRLRDAVSRHARVPRQARLLHRILIVRPSLAPALPQAA